MRCFNNYSTGIPTCTELIEYATKETENKVIPESTTINKPETVEDVAMEGIDFTNKYVSFKAGFIKVVNY